MPSIDDVYGSDETLRASHLPQGRSVPVTIRQVTPKSFDDGGKLELAFVGKQRVLLCNKTNAGLIARVLGSRDYSTWIGQTIHLRAAETEFRGEMVPCVRVDPRTPQAPPQPPTAPPAGDASADTRFVPDDPSDPGGFRADASSLAAAGDQSDTPF